jgi:hypothetical protein
MCGESGTQVDGEGRQQQVIRSMLVQPEDSAAATGTPFQLQDPAVFLRLVLLAWLRKTKG